MRVGGIHQLSPYLQIPLAGLLVQIFVFQIGSFEPSVLRKSSATAFAVAQYMSSHAFPVVQMLNCCVCSLVSIVT